MFRNPSGNGGTSGASQGDENGPSAAPASSSGWSWSGAPRQLVMCVPRDRVPVPLEPETGTVGEKRTAVDDLELGGKQLLEPVESGIRGHVLEAGRVEVDRRAELHVDVGVDVGRELEAGRRCERRRRHELADAADDGRVTAHDVDRPGLQQLAERPVTGEVLAETDQQPGAPPQIGDEGRQALRERVLEVGEVELRQAPQPAERIVEAR